MSTLDLTVRELEMRDAEAVHRAVVESVDHLRPWMPWARQPQDLEQRRAWLHVVRKSRDERIFGAFDAAGTLVGTCGLHRRIGPGGLEVGYWVHVDHVRRGYATAMVRRLVDIALSEHPDVDHLEIHHDVENPASGEVARRAGFTDHGVRPRPPHATTTGTHERIWRLELRRERGGARSGVT